MPAEGLGPAVEQIVHGATMAGQEVLPTPLQVLTPIAPEDVGHLWHGRAPARSEIGHKGRDRGVHDVPGRGRQRRVAGGGPRAPVAQQFLNDPPRHAALQQMGGVGMPERVAGGIFRDAVLAHHELEGLLEGGRRQGCLRVPGREQPGSGACALPVRAQQLQGPFDQWHRAVFAPLALADPDQHALGVDIRDL